MYPSSPNRIAFLVGWDLGFDLDTPEWWMNWNGFVSQPSLPDLMDHPGICLEILKKATGTLK
jgi:hypothetical protein